MFKRNGVINMGKERYSILFSSMTGNTKELADAIREILPDASNTVIGEYMCQGKMPQSVRERYVKMKEDPNHKPNLDMLIENFDRALSHPDKADLEKLQKSVLR